MVGWLVFYYMLQEFSVDNGSRFEEVSLLGSSSLVCVLIWRHAVAGFWAASGHANQGVSVWLALLAYLWCGALLLLQVAYSLTVLLWIALMLDTSPHVMWYT
jgi:hypothetical protein